MIVITWRMISFSLFESASWSYKLIVIILLTAIGFYVLSKGMTNTVLQLNHPTLSSFIENYQRPHKPKSILDGCFHIFLDIGANKGITTRKLFEPKLYPDAPWLVFFDKYFGKYEERVANLTLNPKYICAVGFEADPAQNERLREIERFYQKCGWYVKFYTSTAVHDQKGNVTFSPGVVFDTVGTLLNGTKNWKFNLKKSIQVPSIRLSDFFREHILHRTRNKLETEENQTPKIMAKLDCESCEVEVFFDMINNGLLTYFNFVIVEYHQKWLKDPLRIKRTNRIKQFVEETAKYCRQTSLKGEKLCEFDQTVSGDESYHNSRFPFPNC